VTASPRPRRSGPPVTGADPGSAHRFKASTGNSPLQNRRTSNAGRAGPAAPSQRRAGCRGHQRPRRPGSAWPPWAAAARARGHQPTARIKPWRRDQALGTRRPPTPPTRQPARARQRLRPAGLQRPSGAAIDEVVAAVARTQQANDVQQLANDHRDHRHPNRRHHSAPRPVGSRLRLLVDANLSP
jgi:hypothetical protein